MPAQTLFGQIVIDQITVNLGICVTRHGNQHVELLPLPIRCSPLRRRERLLLLGPADRVAAEQIPRVKILALLSHDRPLQERF